MSHGYHAQVSSHFNNISLLQPRSFPFCLRLKSTAASGVIEWDMTLQTCVLDNRSASADSEWSQMFPDSDAGLNRSTRAVFHPEMSCVYSTGGKKKVLSVSLGDFLLSVLLEIHWRNTLIAHLMLLILKLVLAFPRLTSPMFNCALSVLQMNETESRKRPSQSGWTSTW